MRVRCSSASAALATAALLAALLPGARIASAASVPVSVAPLAVADPALLIDTNKAAERDEIRHLIASAPSALAYPNAAKATLLDLADITVRPDGTTRTVTRQTIKIFNKLAREQEAEVKIPYTSGYESIKVLRARTIHPDGTVVNVQPSDIRDHELNDESGEYSDARVVSFSMPAVDDGSIIDYEYVTDATRSQMPGQFWTDWYFQGGTDPVLLSRLTVTAPKNLNLNPQYKNTATRPAEKASPDGKEVTYTWQQKNVDPIEIEPMMPPPDDIIPAMHLSTIASWQSIADWYTSLAKDRMVATPEIKALAHQLTKDAKTPEAKAKAIYYYVEEKTRYVALELGQGAYQPHPAIETCSKQYGDCKDMATLLVTMLREVGVTAYPVLLKVDPVNDSHTQLPAPGAFNHAICLAEIDGKQYWLDATAQVCPWGQIPQGDRGADAFVIRDGKGKFEQIPYSTPEENQRDVTAKLALSADGSAKGTVEMQGNGEWDLFMRTQLSYLTPDRIKPFFQSLAQNIAPDARVTDYKVSDVTDKDQPVKIAMTVEFPFWASQSGDLLLFKAKPEQTGGGASSPLRDDIRKLPIAQQRAGMGNSVLEVTLPTDYTLLSAPKASTEVVSDLGRFTRNVAVSGSKVTITTRGEDFRAQVPPARYAEVRKYFESFQRASDELVIIKKAGSPINTAQAK